MTLYLILQTVTILAGIGIVNHSFALTIPFILVVSVLATCAILVTVAVKTGRLQ